MNALMKLTAAALGAASIAGGVAVAQSTSTTDPNDARPDTANYGTPPGAPLKRDGSLRADAAASVAASGMATDTSSTTQTTTSNTQWNNPPAAAPAAAEPVAATPAPSYTSTDNTTPAYTAPRADRN